MYQKIYIKDCKDLQSLIKYLYEKHYNDVMNVNENGSLTYYKDSSGMLYAVTDLYRDFEVYNIDKEERDNTISFEQLNLYNSSYSIYNKSEVLPFNTFSKIVRYLIEWWGEYGDAIFEISQKDKEWTISCRIENKE